MTFTEVLRSYFRGEAVEAWFFILPAGLLLLAVGVAVLRGERTSFDWGLAVPCLIFGLTFLGTGLGVGVRTPSQVRSLVTSYEQDAKAMVAAELPRMQKVMRNFRLTFYASGVLAAIGLLLLYAVRAEWAVGVGAALIVSAGCVLVVDGVAERRGRPYVAALEQLAAQPK